MNFPEKTYINQVICGDYNEHLPLIPNNYIDLVVTDPPYGMSYQSNGRQVKHKKIQNDDNLDWLDNWCQELKRVTKKNAHLYIFCSWHNIDVFKQTFEKYFNVKNLLIWDKKSGGMGDLFGDYAPQYEIILFCSNGEKKLNGVRTSNVFRVGRTLNNNHPTEKPVKLLKMLIEKSSNEGDIILDTFAGSFSTAQACKMLNRNFISFEIDEEYCNTAKQLLNKISINEKLF